MGIFNREKEYVIVTDMATNRKIQEIVNRICDDECELDVEVHGCLLRDNNLVTIGFATDIPEADIYAKLNNECRKEEIKLGIKRALIFAFNKTEEES